VFLCFCEMENEKKLTFIFRKGTLSAICCNC